jgi:hypothetical protein
MSDRDAVADRQTTSTNEGSKVLRAITRAQVDEVISLLERLSAARKARAAEDQTQSPDEIIHGPQRRELSDYLYALSDETRGELIVLMLVGRGDVDHSYEKALDTRSKYTSADDQVAYLVSKTVRLAEYLRIGLDAVGRSD